MNKTRALTVIYAFGGMLAGFLTMKGCENIFFRGEFAYSTMEMSAISSATLFLGATIGATVGYFLSSGFRPNWWSLKLLVLASLCFAMGISVFTHASLANIASYVLMIIIVVSASVAGHAIRKKA